MLEERIRRRRSGEAPQEHYEMMVLRKDGRRVPVDVLAKILEGNRYLAIVRDVTQPVLIEAATAAITSDLDPTQAVSSFAEVLRKAVPFAQFTLSLVEGKELRRLVSVGNYTDTFPTGEKLLLDLTAMSDVVRTRRHVVTRDIGSSPYSFDERLKDAGITSYVIVPLIQHNEVFATFNVAFNEPDLLTDPTVELLTAITSSVAQAVRHIVVFEQQREAIARLKDLDRARDDFVSMVAHDLRTPITLISGLSHLLMTRAEDLPEETKTLLDRLFKGVRKMSTLVDEILEITKIESGAIRFQTEPFDIAAMILRTVADYSLSFPSAKLSVEILEDVPLAFGDERRQWQILTNLLGNAVKFSGDQPRVVVGLNRSDDMLIVSVRDNGMGIRSEDIPRLFGRFSRLPPQRPSVKGTGLGLYLSRLMVEAQGGTIWVDSEPGAGSTFSYTVPVAG